MAANEKIPVLAVVGPTASGKTALGVSLAEYYGGEVVSADSMQIYKGMSIATAKPTKEEMRGVPHHLIDFLDMGESFSVADYIRLAGDTICDIHRREMIPIIVGGTGLYVSSLLDNVQFSKSCANPALRDELVSYANENGAQALHARLEAIDPDAAESIHPNNIIRVVRALEVCIDTGEQFSKHKANSRMAETPYDSMIIGLDYASRYDLYDRINMRVDKMIDMGLVEEAFDIWVHGRLKTASNAIGYKELVPYFEGSKELDACINEIKLQTRHYAKRQLTWFRKNKHISWIILDKTDNLKKIQEKCLKVIAKNKFL
ncbi:MAG: tRNA (adenosine(37)-N6)-dimethylallyltransferase MiaA [Ruminococcus sp.]|nr:tRNA (adenosine(37)-N6)-dimethylallyltransferase MiaA [Ruminococcus sp.]